MDKLNIISLFTIHFTLFGIFVLQPPAQAQLDTYDFESLDSLQKTEARPVVVFLNAEWCKYCETMRNSTFKDQKVINLLNQYFYFIPFDGEQTEDVSFLNHVFKYKPTGKNTGIHELAEQLGTVDGSVSYPTITSLNSKYEITFQHASFLNTKQMMKVLKALLQ